LANLLHDAEDGGLALDVECTVAVAQLVQDLVHLERGQDRLDQHRGADGAAGNAQLILRDIEDVVPEASLEVALELGQIEIWAAALVEKPPGVVKEIEAEVEQGT